MEKNYKEIVERLEAKFKKKYRLKLGPQYKHPENRKLEQFIAYLINCPYESVTFRSGVKQCKPYANRSLADLYKISQNYYPDITLDVFFKAFSKAMYQNNHYGIASMYCGNVRKRVFYQSYPHNHMSGEDENGLTNEFYNNLKNL